ncbi:PAS domain-containing hybrid sensor histidine kinase/response regulator [Peloplasma aerotolerans]|uniref:Circadian input-output histidine kinase CikA n=1 Tax=Peloplasma aerotolerans TaxID=3044389 RepID=A0AAW6UBX0_9MOLU|nr:PAS domain-containing hybrid sensor histidine kinase/response regulator [Mariniplasma sp. M4Ah]MDI6452443.1 response regulator [Mariniplasma sp. M4Ah]
MKSTLPKHVENIFNEIDALTKIGKWYFNFEDDQLLWSKESYKIFELDTKIPITEEKFISMIHPEDYEVVLATWDESKTFGTPYHIMHRIITSKGIKWVAVHSKILFNDEKMVIGAYGSMLDVTDHQDHIHLLESQKSELIQSIEEKILELEHAKSQAEQSNLAKTSFLSNMSHEIRTPMNAIIGFTHLIEEKTNDPEHLEYINRIKDASNHLLGIINNILDLSKIEAGKMLIEQRAFKLDKLLEEVKSLVYENVKQKNLFFDIEKIDCPEVFIGDVNRIRQILINVLSNAVKFTETGGISLVCYVDEKLEDHLVKISFKVKDTGIGMTKGQKKRLFEEFEQADTSTTRIYGGTGLGLSISKKLAELMHGKIEVESELNEGSEFIVTIPLEVDEHESTRKQIEKDEEVLPKPKVGSRILVAEDNFLSQKLAHRILTNMGMIVTVANNGKIAVDLSKTNQYDLIILDIQMPIMDGLEAAKEIRKIDEKTPILAMTANAFAEDRALCLNAGMNDFLAKPIDPKSLSKALSNWLPSED